MKTYHIYILTNVIRKVLYVGFTGDFQDRLLKHRNCYYPAAYTSRYKCFYLLYFETYTSADLAIAREKELKGWSKERKLELIRKVNPDLAFLDY